jgi:hypothetical protein
VTNESDRSEDEGEDDADVPEEIETVLEDLFQGLQDRVSSRTRSRKAIYTCVRILSCGGLPQKVSRGSQNVFQRNVLVKSSIL